jgi:hypothetical protein
MTGTRTREYVLELDAEADPITGRIHDGGGGDAYDFTGWLGLASALERLISAATGTTTNEAAPELDF